MTFDIVEGNDLGHFRIDGYVQWIDMLSVVIVLEVHVSSVCMLCVYTCRDNLVTTQALEYDIASSGNQSYTLRIIVNDTMHYDDVTLTVDVVDINDNEPAFENTTYL